MLTYNQDSEIWNPCKGILMIGVLVMASDSLMADAIVSNLEQDATLRVRRIINQEADQVAQVLHEDCSVVIIVEDGRSNDSSITAGHLLRQDRSLRIITISSQKHNLHIYDGYEMPASSMAQVVRLAKGFNQANLSEVTK
jgi:hypothetical protein